MDLITWSNKEYCLGISDIDLQHRVLVNLINKLSVAINTGKTDKTISLSFQQFTEYAKVHF